MDHGPHNHAGHGTGAATLAPILRCPIVVMPIGEQSKMLQFLLLAPTEPITRLLTATVVILSRAAAPRQEVPRQAPNRGRFHQRQSAAAAPVHHNQPRGSEHQAMERGHPQNYRVATSQGGPLLLPRPCSTGDNQKDQPNTHWNIATPFQVKIFFI